MHVTGSHGAHTVTTEDHRNIPLRVGAKAGLCVGPFWALANIVSSLALRNFDFRTATIFVGHIRTPMIVYLIAVAVEGAIVFAVIGLCFVRFREHVPGYTMVEKGMWTMLIIWVFLELMIIGGILRGAIPNETLLPDAMLRIISNAAAGSVLGYLVQKLSKISKSTA